MELPPLTDGMILRRYKRFLADVELLDGRKVIAHCPNTGRMTGCWQAGAPVQLSHSDNPRRKLAWTLERVDMGGGWIGVNTHRVNAVIAEGLAAGKFSSLSGYQRLRSEVTCGSEGTRSRLDIVLDQGDGPDVYIEVKNVTLLQDELLQFPDARTERGRKHLNTLLELVARRQRGVMIYALNRPEGSAFAVADSIDPEYAVTLGRALESGVEVIAVRLHHTDTGIEVAEEVPLVQ